MKRRLSIALVVLFAILLLPGASSSAEQQTELPYFVSDAAGLLTTEQWQRLENTAKSISEQYRCGVYIVTLDDYRDFGSYSSFWDFSEEFYTRYHMGLGERRNGILLILSMDDRDYSLLAYGSDANYAFTDYGKDVLENRFLDNFRRDDWNGGFSDYLDGCAELLSKAANGTPVDVSYDSRGEMPDSVSTAIIAGVPLLTGFGICEGMRRKMKPVRRQTKADEYILPGGIDLSLKRDVFVNRTVTRTVIRTENRDSNFGGGGTTVNSHGFSGHSGKF